jgi:hypothetical protein
VTAADGTVEVLGGVRVKIEFDTATEDPFGVGAFEQTLIGAVVGSVTSLGGVYLTARLNRSDQKTAARDAAEQARGPSLASRLHGSSRWSHGVRRCGDGTLPSLGRTAVRLGSCKPLRMT